MTELATRKKDREAIAKLLAARKRIDALKAKIKKEEDESAEVEHFLRTQHPDGIALELSRGKAAIVEFNSYKREMVNIEAVRKLLKVVPMKTIKVETTRIVKGVIESGN